MPLDKTGGKTGKPLETLKKGPLSPEDVFQCQQCGDCCKGYGGTYVSEADLIAIARYIGTDAAGFRERYCRPSGRRFVLAQGGDGYCIFYRNRLCGIHPVKPKMCRNWPFIKAVLVDPANWGRMAGSCPGIRTDVAEADLLACVRKVLADREAS